MNPLKLLLFIILTFTLFEITAQEKKLSIKSLTREEIIQLSTDELLSMPFEDLLVLAEEMGVTIDELLKMQTSVASKKELTSRESPGIISIITSEEINSAGARDMIDVLNLVPGFDFEYDVDGVIGVGLRGSWVHEGKALILLDGQMMNDLAYYNTPFGNHFDVTQIKRIEIIRGPGSAIYGGNAELCVINIITKNGSDLKGVTASAGYGQLPETYGRINSSLQIGNKSGKWDYAFKSFFGRANRNNGKYETSKTTTQDFGINGGKVNTENINVSVNREKLSFQFLYDNYKSQAMSEEIPTYNKFKNIASSAKYDIQLSEKLTVSPLLSYQYNKPYDNLLLADGIGYLVQRYKFGTGLNYDFSQNINFIAGFELYRDKGEITDEELGSRNINLNNGAFYAQLLWKIAGFNIIAGGRGENNSSYGSAFAPRLGITKVINNFHFKVLASQAFRSPSIGNIDMSRNLEVEKTLVLETEVGYKINDNMFITGNFYDISINKPIIYFEAEDIVPGLDWGYYNGESQGSNGFELEYRYKYLWGYSTVNYSYYTNKLKATPDYYNANGYDGSVLGFPQQKLTYSANFKISEKTSVEPSFVYSGKRYGSIFQEDESVDIITFDPSFMLNLNISFTNLLLKNLSCNLGLYNIFNSSSSYIQPYKGRNPSYPGREREIMFRLIYCFKFIR